MGLNITVLHVRGADIDAVGTAIVQTVAALGWTLRGHAVLRSPPEPCAPNALQYLVAPSAGGWISVLTGHGYRTRAPTGQDLAEALSKALSTHALALSVMHSDVLSYWFGANGIKADTYNSCPPILSEKFSARHFAKQRHHPDVLASFLPSGASVVELKSLLDRGWWAAYDGGRLNSHFVPPEDEPGFVFEDDRLMALGNLLQLHGADHDYPYAGWPEDNAFEWAGFHEWTFMEE